MQRLGLSHLLRLFLLLACVVISKEAFTQEYKCLYYSVYSLLDFKPKESNDFRILFTVQGDSLTDVRIETLDTAKSATNEALAIIDRNIKRIRVKDLQYCFEQPLINQRFLVILSARNYMPIKFREPNISETQESWEKLRAHKESAVFINLGSVIYYEGH